MASSANDAPSNHEAGESEMQRRLLSVTLHGVELWLDCEAPAVRCAVAAAHCGPGRAQNHSKIKNLITNFGFLASQSKNYTLDNMLSILFWIEKDYIK